MLKAGDRVRRTTTGMFVPEACKNMVKGDEYIVSESRGAVIELKGFGNFTFNAFYFELVKGPIVETSKKTPHKHADMIKAWADGANIEFRSSPECTWRDLRSETPSWLTTTEYRVKPEPKPDFVKYARVDRFNGHQFWCKFEQDKANVLYTFDGETGKLKKAEVI